MRLINDFMSKQNETISYINPFYNEKYQNSKPIIVTENKPIIYKGIKIYHRINSYHSGGNVFDVVCEGKCVAMRAGIEGAKKFIDENLK